MTFRGLLIMAGFVHDGCMSQSDTPPPDDDRPRSFPLSKPPQESTNWWKSIPGQLSILIMAGALMLIICQLAGIINVRE